MSAKRIRGRIIHHCRDEHGKISIADEGATRSLYFGDVQQSTICLDRPEALVDDYSQAMMTVLALRPRPRSVLLIGLGGCALVHFLLQACPASDIHVVEIRQAVIELAYDFFYLPRAAGNLFVHHASGQDFIARRQEVAGDFDLILSDAFDEGGPAADLLQQEFLTACRGRLGTAGIFVMNFWNRPKDGFPARCFRLQQVLGGTVLRMVPGEACCNALAFWSADPGVFHDLPSHRPIARQLQRQHGVNIPRYLMLLHRQNFA